MRTAQIAYDTNTGRIVLAHLFEAEADDAELTRRFAIEQGELPDDQVAVIEIPADEVDATRFYRVDPDSKTLTEAGTGEDGVSFSAEGTLAPDQAESPGY